MALTSDMKKNTDPLKPNRMDEAAQAEANILPKPKMTRKVSSRTRAANPQAADEPLPDGAYASTDNSLDSAEEITLDRVLGDRSTSADHLSPVISSSPVINDSQSAKYFSNRTPNFPSPYPPYPSANQSMGQPIGQSASQSIGQSIGQSSDRIAIFIDGSNLFYAASQLNIEVDYRRLLTTLVGGRRLLRAYFYTGVDPQNEKQRGFLLWLNRHGHRVVSKELAQLPDGSRKANMHVEMAVDMMRISEYCSTLTLLGGDGNLSYALQVLSQRGTSIEVVSLQSMTSDSLIDLADAYTDLADLREEIKR